MKHFQIKCPRSTKTTGCCAWSRPSSSWSDCACDHLSSSGTFSCSPSLCNKSDCGINCLYGNFHVVAHSDCIGCFNDSHSSCNNAAGNLNHGCKQREDEPPSSLLVAFSPWACQGHRPLYKQSDTAKKKLWAKEGPWAPFCLFPLTCTASQDPKKF